MNYNECIHYLEEEVGFGSVPGLERIQALCDKLGNPEKKLSVIHVAGTNGKGSAVAMLSSILQEAGYRVGTYTSPHLECYNERFLINGQQISDEDFANEITLMKEACAELKEEGQAVPTLFEIVTGVAFHYFAEQKVDILILEVGLGGKYDATNIVPNPLLSLIMSISIDHTDFLEVVLQACHTYNVESYSIKKFVTEKGLPYMAIETDYSSSDIGQLNTRCAAFIEML